MRVEPVKPIFPIKSSRDKNPSFQASQEERQGYNRAFEEQLKRHAEERRKNQSSKETENTDTKVLSKRLKR